MGAPDPHLVRWLETTFRNAVNDDDRIRQAAAYLKVGRDRGDDTIDVVRACIAAFVLELIDPGMLDSIYPHEWYRRN